jgi:hypothetical protein
MDKAMQRFNTRHAVTSFADLPLIRSALRRLLLLIGALLALCALPSAAQVPGSS